MISKLTTISNIGSFFLFDWDSSNPSLVFDAHGQPISNKNGNPKVIKNEFNKHNVFFGENGAGKTTIVKIFKSLNTDSGESLKKHWDHEGDTSSFVIETDSGAINYDDVNGIQNDSLKDKILFFDRDFIENFIHSSRTGRDANHNKNTGKLMLYLGDFFQYKVQLDNLSQLIDKLEKVNRGLGIKNDTSYSSITSVYGQDEVKKAVLNITEGSPDKLQDQIDDIEKQSLILSSDIQKIVKSLSQSEEIKKIVEPDTFNTLVHPDKNKVESAFNFTIGLSAARTIVEINKKENFIREGADIINKEKLDICPFCKQGIKDKNGYIDPISEYEKIFDAEFIKNQDKTIRTLEAYKTHILNILGTKNPNNNLDVITCVNKLIGTEFILPDLSLTDAQVEIFKKEIANIDSKLRNITIKATADITSITEAINDVNGKIQAYNLVIEEVKSKLLKIKLDIDSGALEKQKNDLASELEKNNYEIFVCKNYLALINIFKCEAKIADNKEVIRQLRQIFDSLRKKVEYSFKTFVDIHFGEIEKNLNIFCPELKLKIIGSHPKYDLRIGDVTCGLEVVYNSKDRLNELSEGEKQAIAISYFLADLNKQQNKNKKIVVFDDPINCFDAGKRKQAAEQIYKEAINYNQSFIFTCDSLFRCYCLKFCNKALGQSRNFYYILKSASSSIHFRPKELYTIYSTFRNDFRNVNSVSGTDDMIVIYGQKLRYCLEEIKDRHLGYSEDKFEYILDAIQSGRVKDVVSKIEDIREIYSYCNTGGLAHFPKDGQTSWHELKGQIDRYIKLGL